MTTEHKDKYRLPTNVRPTNYDLSIKTDLEKLEFDGVVQINLDVLQDSTSISLNSSDLHLGPASLYLADSQVEHQLESKSLEITAERVTFYTPSCLLSGSKASLRIEFSGKLSGCMTGYYKSSYETGGKQKFYALTQFEPTAARRAFPCWDEPMLKATFSVTLISRQNTINLSNMPSISELDFSGETPISSDDIGCTKLLCSLKNDDREWKITRFKKSPPMSTYIVAYANGDFKHLETSVIMPLSGKTIPLRIYATAESIHQAQFALDVKAKVLPLYEKVFEVEYPLPKLDTLVASDFDAGAMENWGLIIGRTSAFLLDPKKSDLQAKKNIAGTTSHEVAHMWFGNITTMEWWDYLYLNEGFATLMGEVIIADKVFPEWKVNSEFITQHLNRALSLDAKLSSHPIEVDCPDANRINQIFDSLSYSKAASVLRMLANHVGEDKFLKGVAIYLKNHLYGNSVSKDLWEGIGKATDIDAVKLMDNWVSKIGFPVLTVTETADGIRVRQDRFLEAGCVSEEDNQTLWNVPLSILSVSGEGKVIHDKEAVLYEREQTFKINTGKPFKLNTGTTGVFRVLYSQERFAQIAEEAAKPDGQSLFDLDDRIGLVHDAMALSKAGLAKLSSALTLVYFLRKEKEYLVWSGIAENLSSLVSIWWEHPKLLERLNAFRRELFSPLVQRLGYEYTDADSVDTSLLRTISITQSAAAGDEKVIEEIQSRFSHFVKTGDDSKIPADLQRIIFTTAVRHGGKAEYDAVVKLYNSPKTPTTGIAAMIAMGATHDQELLKDTFKFITTKSRDQDVLYFFRGLGHNFEARRSLSYYFKDNYDALYERFKGNFMLKYLVEMSMEYFSTDDDRVEVIRFFKNKDTSKYDLSLAQVLDGIKTKVEYIKRSSKDLEEWFELRNLHKA